jgi:hypothetical protein
MTIRANAKHSAGLLFVALGGAGLIFSVIGLSAGIAGLVGPLIGCSAVAVFPSVYLLLRGWRMRTRAIQAGSTMHLDQLGDAAGNVRTSHTEAAKPSFLKNRPPRDG